MTLLGGLLPSLLLGPALCAPDAASGSCPDHWVDASFLDLGCLMFNGSKNYTWEEANNYCQTDQNATLVEIETEVQLSFLRSQLELLADNGASHDWWTAGNDIGREGDWYWVSSLTHIGGFIWSNTQPDGGTSQNCLSLENSWGFMGRSYFCTSTFWPICQKK
jgi:hypothetical protein